MSYVVVRLYSGKGSRSVDELLRIAAAELAPEIMKTKGIQRYSLIKLDDGRIGSTSLFEDRTSVDRANQTAADWVKRTGAMQGYQLEQVLRGERIYGFHGSGDQSLRNAPGCMRIYDTPASSADVKAALEQEADPILRRAQGVLRYTAVKLDEGGCLVLTAHETQESMQALTAQAKEARDRPDSKLQKALPQDPQVITGMVAESFSR